MITKCRRKTFENLCKRRGYGIASAMSCVVSQDGDMWFIDTDHAAYPRKRTISSWKPIPVGDVVEKALSAIGITESVVQILTRTTGKSGGCGCQRRKKWLNEIGNKFQLSAMSGAIALRKFYFGDA